MTGHVPGAPALVPLVSYPKSGNTWIRAFLSAWFRGRLDGLGNLVAPPILALRTYFDDTTGVSSSDLSLDEIDLLRPAFHRSLSDVMRDRCFIKVHDRWYRNRDGHPVFAGDACHGAIHVVRHPAAVAQSYADHLRITPAEAVSLMADAEAVLDGEAGQMATRMPQRVGSWSAHAASWQDQAEVPLLTLRYEDLSRDPAAGFAAILAFVGIEPEPARVAAAVAESGFARLRALEQHGGFRERAGSHAFFREGKPLGWRGTIDAGLLDRLVADHGAVMARFGYDRDGAA